MSAGDSGIVFAYNCVNVSTGNITLFRIQTDGTFELMEAVTASSRSASLTNHCQGKSPYIGLLLNAVNLLAKEQWPTPKANKNWASGDMPTLLLVSWTPKFVELRPLTSYPTLLPILHAILEEARSSGITCKNNDGIILTPSFVGTFDEKPVVLQDPYAVLGLPNVNRLYTNNDYTKMRKGGNLGKLNIKVAGRNVAITTEMQCITKGGTTEISDIKQ